MQLDTYIRTTVWLLVIACVAWCFTGCGAECSGLEYNNVCINGASEYTYIQAAIDAAKAAGAPESRLTIELDAEQIPGYAGQYWESWVWVWWPEPWEIQHTALAHELAHWVVDNTHGSYDYTHELTPEVEAYIRQAAEDALSRALE